MPAFLLLYLYLAKQTLLCVYLGLSLSCGKDNVACIALPTYRAENAAASPSTCSALWLEGGGRGHRWR
jgi:hypothetical protein